MQETRPWDYVIVTAANDQQARSYEIQLQLREVAGELQGVRNCLVVPDIDGRRIGSGGSTIHCLARVLDRECPGSGARSFDEAEAVLSKLRILIVHAGGDSRRLPPYSHCGKMFVPIPDRGCCHTATTLFDRLVPAFLGLPEARSGQVVIASGDALILFDPSTVDLSRPGITALGAWSSPQEAAHHGVFCALDDGEVTRYLQKPSRDEQLRAGAVNYAGQSALDLGVMSCEATAAVQLMRTFLTQSSRPDGELGLVWKEKARAALLSHGIDLYREICCALGADTSLVQYMQNLRAGGSCFEDALITEWFRSLHEIPLHVRILHGKFLHFGTTRQLITSGMALCEEDSGKPAIEALILNCEIQAEVKGDHAWIEACSIDAILELEGFNVVVGADISEPLTLPQGACLDISMGTSRGGRAVWFLRCYDIDDSFKHSAEAGGTFCGIQLGQWLDEMGGSVSDIWSSDVPPNERTLWNARVFPALKRHQEFREWLWLFHARSATAEQRSRFWAAERYSSSDITTRVDQSQFQARRSALRSNGKHQGRLASSRFKAQAMTTDRKTQPDVTEVVGRFPYRMALAGGWIDQPFVSKLNPVPPGSMVVVCLQPTFRFMDRAGMATSTRKIAEKLWNGALPDRNPMHLVRELYNAENRGKALPSGSQDMAGLIFPGVSRLDYDCEFEGGFFPCHIESCNDSEVAHWLERVLHVLPIAQRPDGYSPLGKQCLTSEWAQRLSESGKACFDAILGRDIRKLGGSMNETMRCWQALLPDTVAHPLIALDLPRLLAFYQGSYAGAMYSGCGGGYLYVISEDPVPGAIQIKIRLAEAHERFRNRVKTTVESAATQ